MNKRIVLAAAGGAVLLALAAGLFIHLRKGRGQSPADERYSSSGAPGPHEPIKLEANDEPVVPSAWADVYEPAKVWAALRQNGWAKQVLAEPLGEGFLGSWTAFLGSRGEDLAASFKGEVATLAAEQLLADPFRLVWYAGRSSSGAPALVVSDPGRGSRAAFAALGEAVGRGTLEADRCPGPQDGKEEKKAKEKKEKSEPIVIHRWLIAEHAVFAGSAGDRIVLSRQPMAVLQGLCALPPKAARPAGVDFELALATDGFGLDAAALGALAGLGPALRLDFAVENATVVPRGIAGELAAPGRLATAAPPEKLIASIPEETGVVLTLALQLPADLSRKSLQGVFKGERPGANATRQVALLWNPHGSTTDPLELAIVWSAPAAQTKSDHEALRDIFSGPNALESRNVCGLEVLASSKGLLERMNRACSGKTPSLLNGAPAVKAGLLAPASVGLGVNLGKLLSGLLADALKSERGESKAAPPEIESARRLLEALPFMGLRGVAQEKALVPGGYRS